MKNNHENHHSVDIHFQENEMLTLNWDIQPHPVKAHEETEIILKAVNADGTTATKFAIVPEKEMHLLAISEDLTELQHLHPVYEGEGQFKVITKFEYGGNYKLYADFTPEDKAQHLNTHEVEVIGEQCKGELKPDLGEEKIIDDLNFKLEADNTSPNQHTDLIFTVADAVTGKPVSELEPYLDSAGHVVIVSEDRAVFLHVHPTDEVTAGPVVSYMTSFQRQGNYKIWGQFKYSLYGSLCYKCQVNKEINAHK